MPFDADAHARDVLIALSILGITAHASTSMPLAAAIEIDDYPRWVFLLTPLRWSTLYSHDGVDCEPIYGFVDDCPPDAPPSDVAHAIHKQLISDVLGRAVGEIRYLRRRPSC